MMTSERRDGTAIGRMAMGALLGACLACQQLGIANAASQSMSGDKLYELVEAYSAMGNHRVGTNVDRQTNAWFADKLKEIGAKVELQPFAFDFYDNTSTVTIDGKEVPSAALYYEGVGTIDSQEPYLAAPELKAGDRTVLRPGMTFAVDGGISVDGRLGGRIGDSIVVTQTGADFLTDYPREILVLER